MDVIYDIYKKLRSQEIRYLKQQFEQAIFEHEKVGKLFELITQFPEQTEDFYSQKLYGQAPNNTFRVTKTRLKRILENVLLNEKSLSGYGVEIIDQQLQMKKKLLQAEILLGRGSYKAGRSLLMQCIATARKYELYQELFQAEMLMYRHASIRVSADEYGEKVIHIQQLNQKSTDINEALILHYHTTNSLLHKTLDLDALMLIRKQIDRILAISEKTQHPLVWNAHYLSEVYYYQVMSDFDTASIFSKKYLELIRSYPIYYTRQHLANAQIQLAQISLQLGSVEIAEEHAQAALRIYSPDEINYLIILEVLFRIAFFSKNYAQAEEFVKKAFNHPQFETAKMLNAQWHYFAACVAFYKKEYKISNRYLSNTSPLLSDKYGRNIIIRMLEIIILYEMGLFDVIDMRIQSLRPYIKRNIKDDEWFRFQILFKMLYEWYKVGYDFAIASQQLIPLVKELEAHNVETVFRRTDFELIRLEKWIEEKMGWKGGTNEGKK